MQVSLEGTKLVPIKPKMYFTATTLLEPGQWVKLQ